jgi:penicillin amidase
MGTSRRGKRVLYGTAGVIIGGLLLVAALVAWWLSGSRMVYEGRLQFAALDEPVSIRFDARRRPYVRAESLSGALFAQGFLHARERFWQMDLLRRAGSARLAALLGQDLVETDAGLWRAGVPALAERLGDNAGRELEDWIEAYTDGVNAGLASMRQPPPEYLLLGETPEPWRSRDSHAVGAIMAWDSAGNHDAELLRAELERVLPAERLAVFRPTAADADDVPYAWPDAAHAAGQDTGEEAESDPAFELGVQPTVDRRSAMAFLAATEPSTRPPGARIRFGSNGWVVAPARSRDGRALFAFDSHDALGLPNLFYEVHLFHSGGRELRGWSVPGLPGVINGFNRLRAWGFTNIGDSQDLVAFEAPPDDVRIERRSVRVAGGEPVEVERRITRFGPLISEDPPLALRWTAQDVESPSLEPLLQLGLAESLEEFRAAMESFPAPVSNITWADTAGRIGFRTVGRLPIRRSGDGLAPVPAAAGEPWRGLVPTDAMPASIDPGQGYAAAANARVHGSRWPFLVSNDNAPGWRMRRIVEFIEARSDHDLDSMAELQTDHANLQARDDGPRMLELLGGQAPSEPIAREALAELRAWLEDPVNHPDAAGALIFEAWYVALIDRLFAPALDETLYRELLGHRYIVNHALDRLLAQPASPWWRGNADAVVAEALDRALEGLRAEFGDRPERWRLDRRQSLRFEHAFSADVGLLRRLIDRGPFPVGGGHPTVGRAGHIYREPFAVRFGATVRTVLALGDGVEARAVMPGGQSGRFYSRYYDDQLALWLDGSYDELARRPEDVTGPLLELE